AAVFDKLDLATGLVLDGALEKPERVDVLDFAAGAKFFLTDGAYRDVGIDAEGAFLHVVVAYPEPYHQPMQGAGVSHSRGGRSHLGFGHDLEQRGTGTIQVDTSRRFAVRPGEVLVQGLACVFFKVGAGEVDRSFLVAHKKAQRAALNDGYFELADLVVLGEVRIEVVLALELRARRNMRTYRQAEQNGALDSAAIHDRQCTRQRHVDFAGLRIGCGAEARAAV